MALFPTQGAAGVAAAGMKVVQAGHKAVLNAEARKRKGESDREAAVGAFSDVAAESLMHRANEAAGEALLGHLYPVVATADKVVRALPPLPPGRPIPSTLGEVREDLIAAATPFEAGGVSVADERVLTAAARGGAHVLHALAKPVDTLCHVAGVDPEEGLSRAIHRATSATVDAAEKGGRAVIESEQKRAEDYERHMRAAAEGVRSAVKSLFPSDAPRRAAEEDTLSYRAELPLEPPAFDAGRPPDFSDYPDRSIDVRPAKARRKEYDETAVGQPAVVEREKAPASARAERPAPPKPAVAAAAAAACAAAPFRDPALDIIARERASRQAATQRAQAELYDFVHSANCGNMAESHRNLMAAERMYRADLRDTFVRAAVQAPQDIVCPCDTGIHHSGHRAGVGQTITLSDGSQVHFWEHGDPHAFKKDRCILQLMRCDGRLGPYIDRNRHFEGRASHSSKARARAYASATAYFEEALAKYKAAAGKK